jgi:hypothetical protein
MKPLIYDPLDPVPRASRWLELGVAVSRLLNAATGGSADQTMSQRAGLARRAGKRWGCVLCRLLHVFNRDHCEESLRADP